MKSIVLTLLITLFPSAALAGSVKDYHCTDIYADGLNFDLAYLVDDGGHPAVELKRYQNKGKYRCAGFCVEMLASKMPYRVPYFENQTNDNGLPLILFELPISDSKYIFVSLSLDANDRVQGAVIGYQQDSKRNGPENLFYIQTKCSVQPSTGSHFVSSRD